MTRHEKIFTRLLAKPIELFHTHTHTEWGDFFLDQTRHWLATAVNWTFHSSELLTVHYEELKEDPLPQLRRILNFLKLPIDERRLACVQVSLDLTTSQFKHSTLYYINIEWILSLIFLTDPLVVAGWTTEVSTKEIPSPKESNHRLGRKGRLSSTDTTATGSGYSIRRLPQSDQRQSTSSIG